MKKKRLKTLQILLSAFGAAAFWGRHSDCATGCLARGAGWTYLMRASCDSISFSVFSAFVLPGAIRPCATGRPPAGTDHQATVSPARRGRQRHPDEPDRRLSGWRTHDGAIARRRSDHTKAGAAHAVLLRQFRPCLFNQRRWLRHAPQPTGRANPLRGTHCQRAADRALHALSRIQRDDERKPCCSPTGPSMAQALVDAATQGCAGIVSICVWVILFSCIAALFSLLPLPSTLRILLQCF